MVELLKHEKKHGYVVWVLGPACAFDCEAREAFSKLVAEGYVDALLAGNALATHDLEAALLGTALGQDKMCIRDSSRVDKVTSSGQPDMLIDSIPPISDVEEKMCIRDRRLT